MSFRMCGQCGGKKIVTKTVPDEIKKITVRTRRCDDCRTITSSYETEIKPIFSKRETELVEDYRTMRKEFRDVLRSFMRLLKTVQTKLDAYKK